MAPVRSTENREEHRVMAAQDGPPDDWYDIDRVDETVLALLYLTSFRDEYDSVRAGRDTTGRHSTGCTRRAILVYLPARRNPWRCPRKDTSGPRRSSRVCLQRGGRNRRAADMGSGWRGDAGRERFSRACQVRKAFTMTTQPTRREFLGTAAAATAAVAWPSPQSRAAPRRQIQSQQHDQPRPDRLRRRRALP